MAKRGPKGPWKWTPERVNLLAEKLEKWRKSDENYILGKFCVENGIYLELLSRLVERNEKFCHAYNMAKVHQEAVLVMGALKGRFNARAAIFLLKNVAGWR